MNLFTKRYLRFMLPWMVFLAGLLCTGLASYWVKLDIERNEYRQLTFYCDEVRSQIVARLDAHEQVLRVSAALFDLAKISTHSEWLEFSQHMRSGFVQRIHSNVNFLGIQGLGFTALIPSVQLAAYQTQLRAEGFSEFTIHPNGNRDTYAPVLFLEPFNELDILDINGFKLLKRNKLDLLGPGYDMYSKAVLREAMEEARDENRANLSGKVILELEKAENQQVVTLMYMPVYHKNQPLDTIEQRRAALFGWVYSPLRMGDLLDKLVPDLNDNTLAHVHFRVYDGRTVQADKLLYDNAKYSYIKSAKASSIIALETYFNGRVWTLLFEKIHGTLEGIDYSKMWATMGAGVLISSLLFWLMFCYLDLQRFARTDPLTGLFNRRVFLEQLEREIAKVVRLPNYSAALLMLDLDFFKRVNDTYGHSTGDEVLKAFAEVVHNTLRTIDISARLGGEEFAILLSGADKTHVLAMAERLRKQVEEIVIEHKAGPVQITVSIGAIALSVEDFDGEAVLNRADMALYQAKNRGRNQTYWFCLL